ncbi:MAG: Zn-dependent hydrolase [Bacteroidales bacterium]|nr:Zn-dependent hydrolase [Bacteroidales bacterium]
MKKSILSFFCLAAMAACTSSPEDVTNKLDAYATVEIGADSFSGISDNGRQVLNYFKQICGEVDNIYWDQSFGDKKLMTKLPTDAQRVFALVNYGPWDRLDGQSFVEGYGERPLGANFYPADMTDAEFEALDNPDKNSPYTLIRRDADGKLQVIWYHDAYKETLGRLSNSLHAAADYTIKPSVRNYLLKKIDAMNTDSYYESDLAWIEMNDSKMDLVIGPNMTKDDRRYGIKASYEAYVLLKDLELTQTLNEFTEMLPELQQALPVRDEYKAFVPGTASTIFAYKALSYAGAANAGIKKIALNLPYNPQVQAEAGTRTALMSNVSKAKFQKNVRPAGRLLLEREQQNCLDEDAFLWNIAFREVAHGLGVKETVNGKGSITEALGNEALTLEEIKGDVVGVYLNLYLIKKGLINQLVTREDAIATFITALIRSSRFGNAEALGRANIICYNYLKEQGAFAHNSDGLYHIDFDKAETGISALAEKVLTLQATGDRAGADAFVVQYSSVPESLSQDFAAMSRAGIPTDIRFQFVW